MDKELVRRLVLEELSDADVRTDQCDIVRLGWCGRTAGVEETEDGIEVRVLLRDRPNRADFLPKTQIFYTAYTEEEAAREVVFWLRRVEETNIDVYPEDLEDKLR